MLVTTPADGVRCVTIAEPPVNAIGPSCCRELAAVLTDVDGDQDARAVVLTGFGRAFSAGADLRAVRQMDSHSRLALISEFHALVDQVEDLRIPVIAAINGHCAGLGLELALACDLRIASRAASFIASGVNIALIESTYRLPKAIGAACSAEMLLTGLPWGATRAAACGLVSRVVAPSDLESCALALAARIAGLPPRSVEAVKRAVVNAIDSSRQTARAHYADVVRTLIDTPDHEHALNAFAARSVLGSGR